MKQLRIWHPVDPRKYMEVQGSPIYRKNGNAGKDPEVSEVSEVGQPHTLLMIIPR